MRLPNGVRAVSSKSATGSTSASWHTLSTDDRVAAVSDPVKKAILSLAGLLIRN
jgi:hypothetical protein